MEKLISLNFNGQVFPVKICYFLNENGNVSYKSELLGSTISTFPHHQRFDGESEKESLEKLGKALIKALNELLEI